MTVLVTGGSGMLGLHVARALAEQGHNVLSYSTSGAPPCAELVLGQYASNVIFLVVDILDLSSLLRTTEKFDVKGIVHAAALMLESQARARPHDVFSVNVVGTHNILEVGRLRGVRRVIYIGSASEYGRRPDLRPIAEGEVNVEGLYAETKYLGHRLGQRYREVFGLDVRTVRVSSTYGPNTRFNPFRGLAGNTLIAHLCRAAAFGGTIVIESGGDHRRDWTYAADTARGIALAFAAERPNYSVYNIASGCQHTVAEVIAAMHRVEPNASISIGEGQWEDDRLHEASNLRGMLDITRARDDLGYVPRYELHEGLREYVRWWRRIGANRSSSFFSE